MEDERTLIRQAQAGDTAALAQLVTRHHRAIMKAVWDVLAAHLAGDLDVNDLTQDVTQEAILTLMDKLDLFDPDGERASFAGWAVTLARNEAVDAIRYLTGPKRSVQRTASGAASDEEGHWLEQLAARLSSPSRVISRNELVAWIRRSVASLREIDRVVLELCDLESKSVEETAAVLGISSPAVCMRRKRARHNLAKVLWVSAHQYLSGSQVPQSPS